MKDGMRGLAETVDPLKTAGDLASLGVVGATLLKWLPEATAVVGFLWFVLRIYLTILEIREKHRRRPK